MPAYDSMQDAPLAAVAALVRGALASELASSDFLINGIFEDPRDLSVLSGGQLPAMSIWRKQQKQRRLDSITLVHDVDVRFDYVLPATDTDKRECRWPALQAVWEEVAKVVSAGKHPSVDGGTRVLELAGWIDVDDDSPTVEYGFMRGQNYPSFRGGIRLTFCADDLNAAALTTFLGLTASFDQPGEDHTPAAGDELLAVDTIIDLPGYS